MREYLIDAWSRISDFLTRYVAEPFMGIGVRDVIDIVLLAVVLFAIYRFCRMRRAGRVLFGLVAIVVFFALAEFLRFPALSFIARLFAASGFFCVIVIFQPEIRDALEKIGNLTFLNPRSNTVSKKRMGGARAVTEETVSAVFAMSESRTGALIVFEGMTKLGEYIRTGKPVSAEISSLLLRNIFFDNAPLHDGALIIRNMRIIAASCVLPSTRGTLEFGGMGTRHRAAVGLTEVSDALVIIVSEETGNVSVAQNGKLLRNLDPKTLTDILMIYLAGNAYLKQKRETLREDYLEMMDDVSREASEKKDTKPAPLGDDGEFSPEDAMDEVDKLFSGIGKDASERQGETPPADEDSDLQNQ